MSEILRYICINVIQNMKRFKALQLLAALCILSTGVALSQETDDSCFVYARHRYKILNDQEVELTEAPSASNELITQLGKIGQSFDPSQIYPMEQALPQWVFHPEREEPYNVTSIADSAYHGMKNIHFLLRLHSDVRHIGKGNELSELKVSKNNPHFEAHGAFLTRPGGDSIVYAYEGARSVYLSPYLFRLPTNFFQYFERCERIILPNVKDIDIYTNRLFGNAELIKLDKEIYVICSPVEKEPIWISASPEQIYAIELPPAFSPQFIAQVERYLPNIEYAYGVTERDIYTHSNGQRVKTGSRKILNAAPYAYADGHIYDQSTGRLRAYLKYDTLTISVDNLAYLPTEFFAEVSPKYLKIKPSRMTHMQSAGINKAMITYIKKHYNPVKGKLIIEDVQTMPVANTITRRIEEYQYMDGHLYHKNTNDLITIIPNDNLHLTYSQAHHITDGFLQQVKPQSISISATTPEVLYAEDIAFFEDIRKNGIAVDIAAKNITYKSDVYKSPTRRATPPTETVALDSILNVISHNKMATASRTSGSDLDLTFYTSDYGLHNNTMRIGFVVDTHGDISDIALHRLTPEIDSTLTQTLTKMPHWTPATHLDNTVNSVCFARVHFAYRAPEGEAAKFTNLKPLSAYGRNALNPHVPNIIENRESAVSKRVFELVEDNPDTTYTSDIPDTPDTPGIQPIPIITEESEEEEETIYQTVEVQPQFPGGFDKFSKYLQENIKYPDICEKEGIQGRVLVQFVVDTDGSITDVKVIKRVNPYLDREAIRVISHMPRWTPGMQKGQKVRVRFTMPVTFRLESTVAPQQQKKRK